jgi:4-amino-4-deoxy-L-arabinose transferase-like glycosyltransferase
LTIVIVTSLLTLVVRVVAFYAPTPWGASADEWDHIAANLAQGRGYVSNWPKTYISPSALGIAPGSLPYAPTASRVPVPVLYFALIFRLFGVGYPFPLVAGQWLLEVLTGILLLFIALEVFGDKRVAILSAVAWAFYIPELWMANSRYSEPITALLVACLVYALLLALRTKALWRFAIAGLIWGLAVLTRPALVILPAFLLPVWFVLLRRNLRFALLAGTVVVLLGALVISPWVYRNYTLYGEFVLSTLGGQNTFRDHYLIDQGDYLEYRTIPVVCRAQKEVLDRRFGSAADVELSKSITAPMVSRVYSQEAIAKIRQYPGRYLILSLVRVLRLWFNVGYGGGPSRMSYLILIGHLIVLALGAQALVSYRGDWVYKMLPAWALVIHHTLVYGALAGEFRYSLPFVPYLIMPACYTLVRVFASPEAPAPHARRHAART